MNDSDDPPRLRPKAFGHGSVAPLFVRARKLPAVPALPSNMASQPQAFEFVRSADRLDGRGAGSLLPPSLPEAVEGERVLAFARDYVRQHHRRVKGAAATSSIAADRRHAIQAYAEFVGWPVRGAAKKTIAAFAPIDGIAPKHLRCSERTVKVALAEMKRRAKKCKG